MDDEIVSLFRTEGYTPEQTITILTGFVGASILVLGKDSADYSSDAFDVKVIVTEK